MNQRLSKRDIGLIKGALRRTFSRSELRREALQKTVVSHTDPERPRVKKWSRCTDCQTLTPTYLLEIDHIVPLVPLDRSLEEMTWDEVVERLWCTPENLAGVCKACHRRKTLQEMKQRNTNKKLAKKTKAC